MRTRALRDGRILILLLLKPDGVHEYCGHDEKQSSERSVGCPARARRRTRPRRPYSALGVRGRRCPDGRLRRPGLVRGARAHAQRSRFGSRHFHSGSRGGVDSDATPGKPVRARPTGANPAASAYLHSGARQPAAVGARPVPDAASLERRWGSRLRRLLTVPELSV
jgi:hypothetical protein